MFATLNYTHLERAARRLVPLEFICEWSCQITRPCARAVSALAGNPFGDRVIVYPFETAAHLDPGASPKLVSTTEMRF